MTDSSARALSGVFSVASLPLMVAAGRRLKDRSTGVIALLLLASSPFAIRYATEARMYSLLVLLVLAGGLLLCRALENGRKRDLLGLAATTAALALTHYWAMYLLAAAFGWLAWQIIRNGRSGGIRNAHQFEALAALALGALATLPWLPVALFQLLHTGTPWAPLISPRLAIDTIREFAGGRGEAGAVLFVGFILLAFLGVFGRAGTNGIELHWPPSPTTAVLAKVWALTLALAGLAGVLLGVGYAPRYASLVLPVFLLLVTAGVALLPRYRWQPLALALAVLLGGVAAVPNATTPRTTAPRVAAVLNHRALPGDIVAYCPDQLAPAVTRLLHVSSKQITFPPGGAPARVNWIDYAKRVKTSKPHVFARDLIAQAGDHNIWLVWSSSYSKFGTRCFKILTDLKKARPNSEPVVSAYFSVFEHPALLFAPAS